MAAPTDIVMTAINAANTRLNGRVETLQAIGGQVLGNTDAFSNQVVNDAWRKLQNRLADRRYSGLQTDVVFQSVPQTASIDPMVQSYIDYTGFFNGVSLVPTPALPSTLIRPYELTERQNGTQAIFTEMDEILFALPRVAKANWNRQWLWRNNRIYLPGALVATDLSVTYAQLLPDFIDGATPWFQQTIPILNSIDAFADYICREIAVARGDLPGASAFQLSAEDNAEKILNQDSAGGKSILKRSEYGKMQDQYTPNTGADTQPVKRGQ